MSEEAGKHFSSEPEVLAGAKFLATLCFVQTKTRQRALAGSLSMDPGMCTTRWQTIELAFRSSTASIKYYFAENETGFILYAYRAADMLP